MAKRNMQPDESPGPSPLPSVKQSVIQDLSRAITLIYGPPKIGKTTLASQWPGPWFLATEKGQTWISNIHEPTIISSWDHFLDVCLWIDQNRPKTFGDGEPLNTIIIDTADLLYKMCQDSVCEAQGISDPSDAEYGKGFNAVGSEFQRVLVKMTQWQYGMVLISHMQDKQVKSKSNKIDRIQPSIPTTGYKIVHAMADIIMYCYMDERPTFDSDGNPVGVEEHRVIRCAPRNNIVAGDRTGNLPDEIDMSYADIVKFFPQTPNAASASAKLKKRK